jgi:hypothetical protein
MRWLLGLPLLTVLAMPAAADAPAGVTAPPPFVVDCVHRVEGPPGWPYPGWRRHAVFAGPVAFFGLRGYGRQPANVDDGNVSAESPALVRAGRQVTVVPRSPGLRVWWGRGRSAVTLAACPSWQRGFRGRRVGRHTQFLGGFYAPAAGCMEFDVYVYGRPAPYHRRFPLGAPCE